MKKIALIGMAIVLFSNFVFGAFVSLTGDAELDTALGNINIEAKADLSSFTADISVTYNIPQTEVTKLITVENMEPADVFMVYEIAQADNKPVSEVTAVYKKNKGKGWGAVAKELGIKPGSEAFKKMKEKSKAKAEKKEKKNNSEKKTENGKKK